jgi:hypothetical protein
VPRHVARLVTRLVVDYFASRRLVVDYFGTSRGSSRGSLSTTSPTPRVRLLRRVAQLVA